MPSIDEGQNVGPELLEANDDAWPARSDPRHARAQSARDKLMFLITHSAPGGVKEIWRNIAEGLAGDGFDSRLVALYPYRDSVSEEAGGHAWRYVVPERPASLRAVVNLLRALVRLLRDEAPGVVFTAMPAASVLAPVAAALARRGTRVVIAQHNPVDTYNRMLNAADSLVGLLPTVRAIVSVSKAVDASLDTRMTAYRRKRRTIHNALPPAVERLIATLVANKGEGRAPGRKIIATGRLVPQKNYPVLIRAAEHLRDAAIEVVGSGPDEAALRGLDVGSRVRFLGQCTREAALARLAAADVFVQPSLFEGHSLGLIEAAKFGLPLVVSNVPVQIEGVTAGDGTLCGIAVDPHDAVGLAAVLQKLLDDPDHYRYWADRARTLATWSSFETQLAAYRDLASNGTITAGAGMRAAPGILAASPHGSAR